MSVPDGPDSRPRHALTEDILRVVKKRMGVAPAANLDPWAEAAVADAIAIDRRNRSHEVELNPRQVGALWAWMARPNGSHTQGRVTFDAVEGGGLLVRTRPYTYPEGQ